MTVVIEAKLYSPYFLSLTEIIGSLKNPALVSEALYFIIALYDREGNLKLEEFLPCQLFVSIYLEHLRMNLVRPVVDQSPHHLSTR
jgi:hypothetical protein